MIAGTRAPRGAVAAADMYSVAVAWIAGRQRTQHIRRGIPCRALSPLESTGHVNQTAQRRTRVDSYASGTRLDCSDILCSHAQCTRIHDAMICTKGK
jgi:hypothetical protein